MSTFDYKSLRGRALTWTQPGMFDRQFELHAGTERIGLLHFEKIFGSLATAEIGGERWTFKREGFWSPRVTIRQPGSDANIAVFHAGWSLKGTLELPGGASCEWRNTNFWTTQWAFIDRTGQNLVRFQSRGALKTGADIGVEPPAQALRELPLLLALGFYLMILAAESHSAVVMTG